MRCSTTDQENNATIRGQTATLLPKMAQVLASPPKDQLSDETKLGVVELVRYLHRHQPDLVMGQSGLKEYVA